MPGQLARQHRSEAELPGNSIGGSNHTEHCGLAQSTRSHNSQDRCRYTRNCGCNPRHRRSNRGLRELQHGLSGTSQAFHHCVQFIALARRLQHCGNGVGEPSEVVDQVIGLLVVGVRHSGTVGVSAGALVNSFRVNIGVIGKHLEQPLVSNLIDVQVFQHLRSVGTRVGQLIQSRCESQQELLRALLAVVPHSLHLSHRHTGDIRQLLGLSGAFIGPNLDYVKDTLQ